MMSRLTLNLIANFAGKGCTAALSIIFVPLYIKFMGIEAYGLVGFFVTLQAVFSLLDMGLGNTLNREMARNNARQNSAQIMRDTVRTLEWIYLAIAVLVCAIMCSISPIIARYWLTTTHLSVDSATRALMLMGVVIAAQFPVALYSGGFLGLERQVLYNKLLIVFSALRSGGAILVLWLVSPTIYAFFIWQALVSILQTAVFAVALWRTLPESGIRPVFKKEILANVWRFAAGMTGISALAVLLTQTDKILLSKFLTLEMFGYYSLASLVGYSIYALVGPFFATVFPRFSYLVSKGDEAGLTSLYHRVCQALSVFILPLAAVIAIFSKEILLAWTHDPVITEKTYRLVSVLIIGTGLNGLMNIPYALQLAYGWTRLGIWMNIAGVILLVPLVYIMAGRYGAMGAAVVWVLLNVAYITIAIPIMHTRLLKQEKWKWYVRDVGFPLVGALGIALAGRLVFANQGVADAILAIAVTLIMSVSAAALMTTYLRNAATSFLSKAIDYDR